MALLTTDVGERGGVQRYGAELVRALSRLGHEVDLHLTAGVHGLPARALAAGRMVQAARRSDLVWAGHPRLGPLAWSAARTTRRPLVVSTYGFETWLPYSRPWRLALEHADVVTAISRFTCELMGPAGEHALLVPPTWGVDPRSDEPLPGMDERDTVLLVARLDEPYKGADIFLDLAARHADEDLRFVLAGAGEPGPLRDRVAPLANARLHTGLDDESLGSLYRRARAVLLPSRATREPSGRWAGGEGFGIVLLEAALGGAPVLASDEGACPETVGLLGNGLVAAPTVDSFDTALRDLLSDRDAWERFAASGRRAAERFSPDRFTEHVASVVAQIPG